MKKAIINADDFGLSRGVNEGIILAHRRGILTSTTLLANMPAFEHAVRLARENEGLGVGAHLNIVRGKPLSPSNRIRSLLDESGSFPSSLHALVRKLIRGRIRAEDIEEEFRAQIERIQGSGIRISHLDSEKHTHGLPPVLRIVIRLAKDYNIKKIRWIHEFCLSIRILGSAKALAASLAFLSAKKKIEKSAISVPDRFYGLCASGHMTASRLGRILSRLEDGVTEIMVHPGFISSDFEELEKEIGRFYINRHREKELKALLDPGLSRIVEERNISLINFHRL